ncbi:uncharacterized protein EAF02_009889 [Botrytis sinoallii]|uniref:uncharacterized protein n=1 Tax=Botrytis sinoallii TaxID=1463999 RepID=UPI0019018BFC|nr:uncharacterized protein EAF02_009889 [Botrytis sinoallii]KAF7867103.1 hypothetical protein EAF02_009889 [Botrytis sinoallii]
MSTPPGQNGSGTHNDRKVSGNSKVLQSRPRETLPVTAQSDQRLPVAPPISDNTPQHSSANDDRQQVRDVTTGQNPESVPPFNLPSLPSQRPDPQNRFADPFKWQPLPGEPLSQVHGSSLPHDIWRPQNYARHSNPRNDSAAHANPLGPDIWKPQSYARDGDDSHGSRLFIPTPNPRGASSRMNRVDSNQQLPSLAHAVPPTKNKFTQRLPPLARAAPKSNMTYAPRLPSSSQASQPANVRSAPKFPIPSQANPTTNTSSATRQPISIPAVPEHPQLAQDFPHPGTNSAPQPPTQAPTTTLDHIPSEKAEELRDRLFKLTSDYQRLYSVFMSSGNASSNAAHWKSIDIDLPYLFEVRQQIVSFLVATKRFEKGEEIKDLQGFKESQKPFFKNLEDAVGVAVEKMTWLRRNLEGPNGYAYQHQNWYYQVIGNNPRSGCLPSAKGDEGVEGGDDGGGGNDGDAGDGGESIDKATRHGDEHGNLVSPSLDSEDEREMETEKGITM